VKFPAFDYARPATLAQALELLTSEGSMALAGGQSLLPALAMRLAAPALLVDLAALPELRGIAELPDGISIGAATRHRDLLENPLIARHLPLLAHAAAHIGHPAIRNRGTLGGSLAFADPAAELPACVIALDATILIAGRVPRAVPAAAFFVGLLQTALEPGELITGVSIPYPREQLWGFHEFSRRHGDYAAAGLARQATRFVYFGCTDRACLAPSVAALVAQTGSRPEQAPLMAALSADLPMTASPGWRVDTKLQLAAAATRHVLA
jgi:carbon-monoxide dehydrogenase medium subunit